MRTSLPPVIHGRPACASQIHMGEIITVLIQGSCFLFVLWNLLRLENRLEEQVSRLMSIRTPITTAREPAGRDAMKEAPRTENPTTNE